jgi:hypothetical protein
VVVEDSADWLALWMPVGTRMRFLDLADRTRPVPDQVHGEHPTLEFRRGEVLRLMQPGAHSSIWLHWAPDPNPFVDRRQQYPARGARHDAFLGWYVNIEAPYVRTQIGVDTTDLSLDVVVWPDFTWEWKDEHLQQRWEDLGVFTPEETRRIRAEGERVIAAVEARRSPFDGAWLDWRPPEHWAHSDTRSPRGLVPPDAPSPTRRRLTGVDPAFEARMGPM